MTEEKLFEFAKEKNWHKLLQLMKSDHDPEHLALKMNEAQKSLLIEMNAMRALGLLILIEKEKGKYAYVASMLGVKFLEQNPWPD